MAKWNVRRIPMSGAQILELVFAVLWTELGLLIGALLLAFLAPLWATFGVAELANTLSFALVALMAVVLLCAALFTEFGTKVDWGELA